MPKGGTGTIPADPLVGHRFVFLHVCLHFLIYISVSLPHTPFRRTPKIPEERRWLDRRHAEHRFTETPLRFPNLLGIHQLCTFAELAGHNASRFRCVVVQPPYYGDARPGRPLREGEGWGGHFRKQGTHVSNTVSDVKFAALRE